MANINDRFSEYVSRIPAKFYSEDGTPRKVEDPDFQEAINLVFANPISEITQLNAKIARLTEENERLRLSEAAYLKIKAQLADIAKTSASEETETPPYSDIVATPIPIEIVIPVNIPLVSTPVTQFRDDLPKEDQRPSKVSKTTEVVEPVIAQSTEKPTAPTIAAVTSQPTKAKYVPKPGSKPKGRPKKHPLDISPVASKTIKDSERTQAATKATEPVIAKPIEKPSSPTITSVSSQPSKPDYVRQPDSKPSGSTKKHPLVISKIANNTLSESEKTLAPTETLESIIDSHKKPKPAVELLSPLTPTPKTPPGLAPTPTLEPMAKSSIASPPVPSEKPLPIPKAPAIPQYKFARKSAAVAENQVSAPAVEPKSPAQQSFTPPQKPAAPVVRYITVPAPKNVSSITPEMIRNTVSPAIPQKPPAAAGTQPPKTPLAPNFAVFGNPTRVISNVVSNDVQNLWVSTAPGNPANKK